MKNIKKTGNMFGRHGWGVVMALLLMPVLAFGQFKTYMVTGGNGTVSPAGLQTAQFFPIVATPDAGYEFVDWGATPRDSVIGVKTSTNTYVVLSNSDSNDIFVVTANFQPIQPVLTANHTGNGSITVAGTPNSTTYTATYNENVELIAVPDADGLFSHWSGGISGVDATTNIVMTSDMTVSANFYRPSFNLVIYSQNSDGEIVGDLVPGIGVHSYPYNSYLSSKIEHAEYIINPEKRAYENGYIGTGSAPASGNLDTGSFAITNDSTVTFNWRTDYRVKVTVISSNNNSHITRSPAGWSYVGDDSSKWHEVGTTLQLEAFEGGGETFQGWSGAGVPPGAAADKIINVLVNDAKDITALFDKVIADSDKDGLPDLWEAAYGLDSTDPTGDNGAYGDPDNDGLNNITEYNISHVVITNASMVDVEASPINADSDGDGMDDGYEYNYILNNSDGSAGTNVVSGGDGVQFNALAVVNRHGVYSESGNPDGDYHWSTNSGYEMSEAPLISGLINIEEYTGPDGELPGEWPLIAYGTITKPVARYTPRIEDTGDQSRSDKTDSESYGSDSSGDGFDDGFEYDWDRWQRLHSGEISRVYVLTNGVAVTNFVAPWPAERHFNPAVGASENAQADNDLIYDPVTGKIGDWLTDAMEYNAWQDSVSPLDRRVYPERRRCTNPFLWDTDGDRMPDGWEMAFGYDPWSQITYGHLVPDGDENPDYDWYANDGSNKHYNVYLAHGFNPKTGYWYNNYIPNSTDKVNTEEFVNYEELIGRRGYAAIVPFDPDDISTMPNSVDSDNDGIWDGWELYVNLDGKDATDASHDEDNTKSFDNPPTTKKDGLTCFEEFNSFATSSTNFPSLEHVVGWYNKSQPTDPWDVDTDGDQIWDGEEKLTFNNGEQTFENGGLTPTTADTDQDHMPDGWEAYYAGIYDADNAMTNIIHYEKDGNNITVTNVTHWFGGVSGTLKDASGDADGDGLLNYQEYMIGSVPMWQYLYNNGDPAWVNFTVSDDPFDFFNENLSNGGEWFTGPGGRRPHEGDNVYKIGPEWHKIPWNFITAAEPLPGLIMYSTADPTSVDTDSDDMDDYWEVFHGLNPLYGLVDIVYSKTVGGFSGSFPHIDQNKNPISGVPDLKLYPWVSGHPSIDVDQDEIPNIYESAQPNGTVPHYHTDPSPEWITDTSLPESWVNSQYWLGGFYDNEYWYWDQNVLDLLAAPPHYIYSFEIEEGFDTDNDNLADHAELVGGPISPGVTDPLESQTPIKRRALYLDGNSAARMMAPVSHKKTADMRTFTIESWVLPVNPASGSEQIIVERAGLFPEGNQQSGSGITLRRNCVLGIDKDGHPFAGYDGAGESSIFVDIKAPSDVTLVANEWTHLSATYGGDYQSDGQWVGILKLFVNGEIVAATPSSIIPQTDWYGSEGSGLSIGILVPMVVTVGAGDNNPAGWVDGASILTGPAAGGAHTAPDLHSRFTGWVDQVHLWNGEREDGDIRSSMTHRYTRKEVAASITNVLSPQMRYVFSFDDLPDPDHSPIAPDGFSLLNGRPAGYISIPWWASAADKSTVYTDYMYVPWIDNLAGHGAASPALDSIITATSVVVTNVVGSNNVVTTSYVVEYPNTSNPYRMIYVTGTRSCGERHPHLKGPLTSYGGTAIYPDLLPLGNAQADEDVVLWDGGGLGTAPFDTDGDGIDDDWETRYGFDPFDGSATGGAYDDPDEDGLINLYEYFAWKNNSIPLNPWLFSSTTNGISDYYRLSASNSLTIGELYDDTDNLPDGWESGYTGLDRYYYNRTADTDGDGWNNQSEYLAGTDPTNYRNRPVIRRISGLLKFNGAIYNQKPGMYQVLAYKSKDMNSEPFALKTKFYGNLITFDSRDSIGVPGDSIYLFAYISNEEYEAFKPGFPYAIAGPFNMTYGDVEDVELNIKVQSNIPYYPSFSWIQPNNLPAALVTIRNDDTGVDVLQKWVNSDRSWHLTQLITNNLVFQEHSSELFFCSQDYYEATSLTATNYEFGLPPANYSWKATYGSSQYDQVITNGNIHIPIWSLPSLNIISPKNGDVVVHQVFQFSWNAALNNRIPRFEIQYWPEGAAWVNQKVIAAPFQDAAGNYTIKMPLAVDTRSLFGSGGFVNGNFNWRVRPVQNNGSAGSWTPTETFALDIENVTNNVPLTPTIKGNIMYYGRSSTDNIVVSAYRALKTSTMEDGRIVVTNSLSSFTITGLQDAKYYLVAYIDLNDNHSADEWEPQGIYRDPSLGSRYEFRADIYNVGVVDLSANDLVTDVSILIRDHDTDNNNVPDGWDWEGRPVSLQGDGDFVTLASDVDGDGVMLVDEYGYDSNPYSSDTDGDGLSDAIEIAFGTGLKSDDSDGDGVGDLMEIAAGSSPVNSNEVSEVFITDIALGTNGEPVIKWGTFSNSQSVDLNYVLERSADFVNWTEVGSVVSYGDTTAPVSVSDGASQFKGFYRLRVNVK